MDNNNYDEYRNSMPGAGGVGSIERWICGVCGAEVYEDVMTPHALRPYKCTKCGASRGEGQKPNNYPGFDKNNPKT